LRILHALFGAPEDVAAQHTLTRAAHKLMASWLRAGEALMRRLLLIEASLCARPNTRPFVARALRTRVRRAIGFTADDPQAWRVSFRVLVGDTDACAAFDKLRQAPSLSSASLSLSKGARANRTSCRLEAGGSRRPLSAWPLAERYEALVRAFNDPRAIAR